MPKQSSVRFHVAVDGRDTLAEILTAVFDKATNVSPLPVPGILGSPVAVHINGILIDATRFKTDPDAETIEITAPIDPAGDQAAITYIKEVSA